VTEKGMRLILILRRPLAVPADTRCIMVIVGCRRSAVAFASLLGFADHTAHPSRPVGHDAVDTETKKLLDSMAVVVGYMLVK
jgi:hypothetical protein